MLYELVIEKFSITMFLRPRCNASEFLSTINAKRGMKTFNKEVCCAQFKVHFCYTLMPKINVKAF